MYLYIDRHILFNFHVTLRPGANPMVQQAIWVSSMKTSQYRWCWGVEIIRLVVGHCSKIDLEQMSINNVIVNDLENVIVFYFITDNVLSSKCRTNI